MIDRPLGVQYRNPLMRWVMRHTALSTLFRDSTVTPMPGFNRTLPSRTIPLSGSETGMDQPSANIQAGSYDLTVQTVSKTIPRTPQEAASPQNIQRSTAPVPLSPSPADVMSAAPVSNDAKSKISDTEWRRLQTILRRHEARQVTNPVNSSEALSSIPAHALPEEQESNKTSGTAILDRPSTQKKTQQDILSQDRYRAEITYIAPPEHQAPESISAAAPILPAPLQEEPGSQGELPGAARALRESSNTDEPPKSMPILKQPGTSPKEIASAGSIVQRTPILELGETDITGFAQQDTGSPEKKILPESRAEVTGFPQQDIANPTYPNKLISQAAQPAEDESSFHIAPSRVRSQLPSAPGQPVGETSAVDSQKSDAGLHLQQGTKKSIEEHVTSIDSPQAENIETIPPTGDSIESTSHPPLQAVPLQQAWSVQRVEEPTTSQIEILYPRKPHTSPPIPTPSGSPNVVQKYSADAPAQDIRLTPETEMETRETIPPGQEIVLPNEPRRPIQEKSQPHPCEAFPVQRFSLGELKQPINAPEYIETEIGPLPDDLWRLLDQEPPQSARKAKERIASLPGGETTTRPSQYGTPSLIETLPLNPALESIPRQAENNTQKEELSPLTSGEPGEGTVPERPNDQFEIDALAREVYSKLRNRLSNEWERLRR